MPKKVRLAINLGFSLILLIFLIVKITDMVTHWSEIAWGWRLESSVTFLSVFVIFGIYPLIAIVALSVWLRGVPPIALSVLGLMGGAVLCFFETFLHILETGLKDSDSVAMSYSGATPGISTCVCFISFAMLVISIAELVIAKRKGN